MLQSDEISIFRSIIFASSICLDAPVHFEKIIASLSTSLPDDIAGRHHFHVPIQDLFVTKVYVITVINNCKKEVILF